MKQGILAHLRKRWRVAAAALGIVVLGSTLWVLVAEQPATVAATGPAQQLYEDSAPESAPADTVMAIPVPGQEPASPTARGPEGRSGAGSGGGGVSREGVVASRSRVPSPADPVRSNEGGRVTVKATWQGQQEAGGPLVVRVVMDTHSVDLDGYDLSKMAVLRGGQGVEVAPLSWEAPPGGHHRDGVLTFPSTDGTGRPVLDSDVQVAEMVIRGVAGVPERVLSWEVS